MKTLVFLAVVLFTSVSNAGEIFRFYGTWHTSSNKILDGTMTCDVQNAGVNKWNCHFTGIWQGVPFDYSVDLAGPQSNLTGKATIDGVPYAWAASINTREFRANFNSGRYIGTFNLKRVQK